MSPWVRCVGGLVAAAVLGGCASHRPQSLAERYVRGDRGLRAVTEGATPPRPAPVTDAPPAMPVADTRGTNQAATLEHTNADLAAARLRLTIAPTADHHREVAQIYASLGVRDAAFDHFTAAVGLARRDAASYDGRARIWRDWGFPRLALSDAYRAIHYAPKSAVPQNTLGTLLLNMGLVTEARRAFERAVALDPSASYARANLCTASRRAGDAARSLEACGKAPDHAPVP